MFNLYVIYKFIQVLHNENPRLFSYFETFITMQQNQQMLGFHQQ